MPVSVEELEKLRVVDLKQRLKKRRLSTSGRKAELIERLAGALDEEGQEEEEETSQNGEQHEEEEEEQQEKEEKGEQEEFKGAEEEGTLVESEKKIAAKEQQEPAKSEKAKEKPEKINVEDVGKPGEGEIIEPEQPAVIEVIAQETLLEQAKKEAIEIPQPILGVPSEAIPDEVLVERPVITEPLPGEPEPAEPIPIETVTVAEKKETVMTEPETISEPISAGPSIVEVPTTMDVDMLEESRKRGPEEVMGDEATKRLKTDRDIEGTPTDTLLVKNFVRPFTINAAKEMLSEYGTVDFFWMNDIRSHCYVRYSSVEEAKNAFLAVDGLVWPPAIGSSQLSASFVDWETARKIAEGDEVAPTPFPEPAPTALDNLFSKTEARPQIYFKPLSSEEMNQRKEARAA